MCPAAPLPHCLTLQPPTLGLAYNKQAETRVLL